jgi:hypothetical protein
MVISQTKLKLQSFYMCMGRMMSRKSSGYVELPAEVLGEALASSSPLYYQVLIHMLSRVSIAL